MIYSVWNQGAGRFEYYRGPNQTKANTPTPSHLPRGTEIGVAVDRAAWPLPPGAKKAGSGSAPRGRVASSSSFAGLGSINFSSPGTIAVLLGIAALVYWKS